MLMKVRYILLILLLLVVLSLLLTYNNNSIDITNDKNDNEHYNMDNRYCNVSKLTLNELHVAVIIEPIINTNLNRLGGTGHWFHLLERIINTFHIAKGSIWNHTNAHEEDLYIIFHEKESVEQLNAFGRFLLTIVLSGNCYKRVVFGYSNKIRIIANVMNDTKVIETDGFYKSFVVDLKKSFTNDRFVISDDNNNNDKYDNCFHMIHQVSLTRVQNRFQDWFDTLASYTLFRNISHQVCSIPYDNDEQESINWSKNSSLDDISALSEPLLKTRLNNKLEKLSMLTLTPSPIVWNTNRKKILIYQRDQSRILSLVNYKKCNANVDSGTTDSAKNIANCISSLLSSNDASKTWTTHHMIHSDDRSPCELIKEISTSTVLVTSHGFQSILLLFQPLSSLLVEIYPFMYYKPDLYGFIQVGLRQRFLIARSYLCQETLPFNIPQYAIQGVQWIGGFSHRYCINNFLCKLFVRNQNAYITEDTLARVLMFIKENFP